MTYVDDLSKVKPEEITDIDGKEVVGIIRLPNPPGPYNEFVVCTEAGYNSYNISGKYAINSNQHFIYKPKKVTYVKSMKQLLEEYPSHRFSSQGCLCLTQNLSLSPDFFHWLGKPIPDAPSLDWPRLYLEEREE
jgi:hypothetical protein